MKKAVLSTIRVMTQEEINIMRLKNEVIKEAAGITHYLDIEEVTTGGWVVSVWVDDALVESGEYAIRMLRGLVQIEDAINQALAARNAEQKLAQAESRLDSAEGRAAQEQVKKFFNLG